jgi:hypothetical protein
LTEHDDQYDDLAGWADDDLVRALRAPGTATELADQEQYVAAFREAGGSNVRSLTRRAAGRFGAGGTAVVVTVALTSGVAAAFTGNLPDPVQQVAHSVIGAPAPDSTGHRHDDASGSHHRGGTPPADPGTTSSTNPASAPPSGEPTSTTPSAGDHPTGTGPDDDTTPSDQPSSGETSPATSSGGSASAMTMSAPTHRVGWGETLALTGLVTDASGAPLSGQPVVLQVRGPRHWRIAVETTTDTSGLASATTPAVTRTARFRWKADRGISSSRWLVRMVPTLSLSADVGGSRTTLSLGSAGTRAGDRFQVFRHLAGRTALVRRGQVDATGSATLSVITPRRHAAYAVRLLPTKLHAANRARVRVVPPAPAGLSIAGSATRVTSGGSVTVNGTVVSAAGDALPGHRVVLQRRGPVRWRPVGHAMTDGAGQVSIATPGIAATSRFRLRTDHHVASRILRVVEVPTVTVSAQRGATTVTVFASTTGARAGDRVVLLRRAHGSSVRMRHARLAADGSVTFTVRARAIRTAYVVKLPATKKHGPASDAVTVSAG